MVVDIIRLIFLEMSELRGNVENELERIDPGYVLQEPGSEVITFCGWRQQGRKKEGRLRTVTCRGNGENPIRCKSLRMEWKVSDIPEGGSY